MNLTELGLAVFVAAIWGFNFVVIKVGLGEFPPMLFAALRFTLVAFPGIFFVSRRKIAWRWIIAVGLFIGVIKFALLYIGINMGIPAGLSSVTLQSQVVFTLLFASLIFHETLTNWQKIGVTLSFLGIGLLVLDKAGSTRTVAILLVLAAGLSWAIGNIFLKIAKVPDVFRLFVWIGIIPPVPLLVLSAIFEEGQLDALSKLSWLGLGTLVYTSFISTVLAFGIWGYLINKTSLSIVAPFSLLVPIFGLVFSNLFLGDTLNIIEVIASLLILLGLVLIVILKQGTRAIYGNR